MISTSVILSSRACLGVVEGSVQPVAVDSDRRTLYFPLRHPELVEGSAPVDFQNLKSNPLTTIRHPELTADRRSEGSVPPVAAAVYDRRTSRLPLRHPEPVEGSASVDPQNSQSRPVIEIRHPELVEESDRHSLNHSSHRKAPNAPTQKLRHPELVEGSASVDPQNSQSRPVIEIRHPELVEGSVQPASHSTFLVLSSSLPT